MKFWKKIKSVQKCSKTVLKFDVSASFKLYFSSLHNPSHRLYKLYRPFAQCISSNNKSFFINNGNMVLNTPILNKKRTDRWSMPCYSCSGFESWTNRESRSISFSLYFWKSVKVMITCWFFKHTVIAQTLMN